MAALRTALALAAALAAGCYSPHIKECSIQCGSGGACPSDTTCMGDGYCHADISASCQALGGDGGNQADAKVGDKADAKVGGEPDARPKEPDARVADARPGEPDAKAGEPDAMPCSPTVEFVENNTVEDSIVSNLSIEPNGRTHITYIDAAADTLRYAVREPNADGWSFKTIANASQNLKGQTLDANGGLHVVFSDDTLIPRLRYAHRSPGGDWSVETVDDSAVSIDGAVAVDKNFRVHVVYWWDRVELEYANRTRDGSFWNYDVIDMDGIVGEHPSIGFAPSGALYVSYRAGGADLDLGFAVLGSSSAGWKTSRPDTSGNVGSYTSLAVDASNAAHIAYSDNTNGHLKYAYIPTSGQRTATTADLSDSVGRFNSIAVDAKGNVHISYYDYGNFDLKYAVKRASSAGFVARAIDSAGDVGRHSAIAVDAQGIVHISYIDDTHGDLKYATLCP